MDFINNLIYLSSPIENCFNNTYIIYFILKIVENVLYFKPII